LNKYEIGNFDLNINGNWMALIIKDGEEYAIGARHLLESELEKL